jgi:hypothetical protein
MTASSLTREGLGQVGPGWEGLRPGRQVLSAACVDNKLVRAAIVATECL